MCGKENGACGLYVVVRALRDRVSVRGGGGGGGGGGGVGGVNGLN